MNVAPENSYRIPFYNKVGLAGLYLFSFFSLYSITFATAGIILMALALPFKPDWRRNLLFSPLGLLMGASLALIALGTWRGSLLLPGTLKIQIEEGLRFAKLWLFLLPAIWIEGSERRALLALLLCLTGLTAGMLLSLDHETVHAVLNGERTGFHLRITPFGLYSATALLGLFLFWPRIGQGMGPVSRTCARTGAVLAFLSLLQGLVATQARGAWLALLSAAPVIAILGLLRRDRKPGDTARNAVAKGSLLLLLLGVLLVVLNFDLVKERIVVQIEEFKANQEYSLDHIPQTGIGQRFHLYAFAISKWREHPLLGWGTGSTRRLISESGREDLKINSWKGERVWFDHLHSLYCELLVRFGLIGLLLFGGTAMFLAWQVWKAGRVFAMPTDLWLFTLGVFLMAAVWNLFDFRLLHWDWRFYWMVAWGSGFGLALPRRRS